MIQKKRFAIVLVGLALCAAIGCRNEEASLPIERPVKAIQVQSDEGLILRTFPGRSQATEEVNLSFRVSGQIIKLPVDVGEKVEKGQLIAQLDPRDYKNTVQSLASAIDEANAQFRAMKTGARVEDIHAIEAELTGAKSALHDATLQYNRYKKLYESQAVPKAAYDKAKVGLDVATAKVKVVEQTLIKAKKGSRQEEIDAIQAKIKSLNAQLAIAQAALDETSLKAPFTGNISIKYVDNFQTISAGSPIVKLQDISKIEITVGLPEDLITHIDAIKFTRVTFDAFPGKSFSATIKDIGTDASMQTQTYPVTVIMDQPSDAEILPGMTANVTFGVRTAATTQPGKDGFLLPETAVFENAQKQPAVWIFDENTSTVAEREVTIGKITSQGIRILSGIRPGEWVVTAGVHYLKTGQAVRLMSDNNASNRSKTK